MAEPTYRVVETLLTRRPPPAAIRMAAVAMLSLVVASLVYWQRIPGVSEKLIASRYLVFVRHEYWRLFTSIFIHADPAHLFANSVLFSIMSYLLYGYFGYLIYPTLTLALGGITMGLSLLTYPLHDELLGASGVIYQMAGFWLVLYLALDRQVPFRGRLLRAVGFALVLLVPTSSEHQLNVSYRTHSIGFVVGALAGTIYYALARRKLRGREVVVIETDETGPVP